jgi:hypothetical protein
MGNKRATPLLLLFDPWNAAEKSGSLASQLTWPTR